ncbi:MAG: FtsX-like permease family protein, partial [Acidobacteriota bacterium]
TVIGITRDTDTGSLLGGGRRSGMAFVPIAQRYEQTSFIVARSVGDAGAGSLRALINSADQDVAVESAGSGLIMLGGLWVVVRLVAGVSLAIGIVTLILTMAGLSGVLAHVVLRRTREIGIRKALGADANAIVWLVIRDGARPVVSGTAIGLGLGVLGGFLVRAAIPISAVPVQPLAILLVIIAVVPATLLACYVPARRASRVDPNLTLKEL